VHQLRAHPRPPEDRRASRPRADSESGLRRTQFPGESLEGLRIISQPRLFLNAHELSAMAYEAAACSPCAAVIRRESRESSTPRLGGSITAVSAYWIARHQARRRHRACGHGRAFASRVRVPRDKSEFLLNGILCRCGLTARGTLATDVPMRSPGLQRPRAPSARNIRAKKTPGGCPPGARRKTSTDLTSCAERGAAG
jgi:hypothetical protein